MASNPTITAPVKRACDSCHRRKVKCITDGTAPCRNCVSAGLACTYNAVPQKKGPKGSRAKVISELREAQLAVGSPIDLSFDRRSTPSTFARKQGLLPSAFVESCIEYFFVNIYPSEPVLHRQRVQEAASGMEGSTETYCMIVALCAHVMIQANHKPPISVLSHPDLTHMSHVGIGHVLLKESIRVRQSYDYRENPTQMSVLTSWFYSGCYFGLARENTAWTYLRDATTQAQLLGMHDEETYKHDPLDISRKRALYWLLFIAERTYALHKHRPISLYPTIHPPLLDEVPADRPIAIGLELMINMFKIIDDTFINLWNRVYNTHASAAWITRVQTQLSEAVPAHLECTEVQGVQIRITQQWLRSQAWQLSVCQGLVSSVSNDNPLTFKYPVEIAGGLLTISHQFPQQALDAQGAGLTEKLFDIACCLIDVVACISFSPETFALSPCEYVSRFLAFISMIRGGQSRYLPLLLAKLSEALPNLSLPQSLSVFHTVPAPKLGLNATDSGTLSSNAGDDFSENPSATLPSHVFE